MTTDNNDNHKKKHSLQNSSDSVMSAVSHADKQKPSPLGIGYDIMMLFIISIDLLIILIDNILMSDALRNFGGWLAGNANFVLVIDFVNNYSTPVFTYFNHANLSILGGFFTIFLISEILIRWLLAIINRTYYRWFFFPFVHWYEVIGCFPQLRAFRLLRAVAIGRRLYQLDYRFLPEKWLETGKFYYGILLEELSDKVLLTAVDNIRTQLSSSVDSQALVKKTIDNNRENIESMILSMLRTELAPRLRHELMPANAESPVAKHVGLAVGEAVANTPELKFVLRKIPIAGSMIESQIIDISEKVGYNLADSVNNRLLNDEVLDELFTSIAHGISNIDTSNPALEALVADIIKESLDAFESQVKIQQWQHNAHMEKISYL